MNKPTIPVVELPINFGGVKENFSAQKIQNGYEDGVPDIFGGANLNYWLDGTGQYIDYFKKICDFITNLPVAKTITVDTNGELVYRDWLGGRNFGELVYSAIPLQDSSLKLLDGSVLTYTGVYKNFIDYIASIVSTYSSIFTTESNWQSQVSQYGVCGKFVYDSVNKTVRLPKVTGIIEGTVDVNALGNIVAAGLPLLTTYPSGNHQHSGNVNSENQHTHTKGSMRIYGKITSTDANEPLTFCDSFNSEDALTLGDRITGYGAAPSTAGAGYNTISFDSSRTNATWTGNTSGGSSHTHSYTTSNVGNHTHTVAWGTSTNTVQPQTVKMFVYIVVATSILRTTEEIDVNEIMSEVNSKAELDGSNMVNALSSSAENYFTRLGLPSTTKTDITIPLSGTAITAPSDGYICCTEDIKLTNGTRYLFGTSFAVVSGDSITVEYDTTDENSKIVFVYANGGL